MRMLADLFKLVTLIVIALLGPVHAGVEVEPGSNVSHSTTDPEQAPPRKQREAPSEAKVRHIERSQTGLRNRQELHIGGQHGPVVVDHVMQKQSGIGNHQSMKLGTTDR